MLQCATPFFSNIINSYTKPDGWPSKVVRQFFFTAITVHWPSLLINVKFPRNFSVLSFSSLLDSLLFAMMSVGVIKSGSLIASAVISCYC